MDLWRVRIKKPSLIITHSSFAKRIPSDLEMLSDENGLSLS